MKVEFWGAAQTVTGSKHLIHFQGKQLLLDCGIYQGRRKEAFRRNRELPFDASQVDAVVLSHSHIDHSGNLPSLVRSGFDGRIHATPATRDLAVHMLLDSAKIQESDVKYVNKKRAKKGQTPFEPLYVQEDAVRTINKIQCEDFERPFQPIPGVTCHLHFAGHMLGAAVVELDFQPDDGKPFKLVFSGDLGRSEVPILKDPSIVADADYVIMESTYGNRNHEPGGDADAMLLRAAKSTYEENGKLIIPAFRWAELKKSFIAWTNFTNPTNCLQWKYSSTAPWPLTHRLCFVSILNASMNGSFNSCSARRIKIL